MASYPSLPIRTRVRPEQDQFRQDVADDGSVRSIDFADRTLYRIEIRHRWLSASERDTLISWWDTNKGSVITIPAADGHDYECPLVGEPEVEDETATRFSVRATLRGNRAD